MRVIDADKLVGCKVQGEIGNLSGDFVPGYCIEMCAAISDEEFKVEAKRRGYNISKIPEKVALLPCICGSTKRRLWYYNGMGFYKCIKCDVASKGAKTDRQRKLNWNAMIEEKMKDG